jgi:hypothetical protein
MADESQPGRRRAAKKKATARKTPAPKRAMADATATDRPPKTVAGPRTTKYLVTVDNVTGLMLKVDKVTEAAGKSPAKTTAVDPSSLSSALAAPSADPTAIVQAYYRGIADYFNTLMTIK